MRLRPVAGIGKELLHTSTPHNLLSSAAAMNAIIQTSKSLSILSSSIQIELLEQYV
jgi:hypothetical protein